MEEIVLRNLDASFLEQSMGRSIIEALFVIGMLAFIIWNIKLSFEKAK